MPPSSIDDGLLERLRAAAAAAAPHAYHPYSGLAVRAAVETTDGRVYGGANVESVNFSLSKHAEEVAILAAISDGALGRCGRRWLRLLYVVSVPPCGSCRQFAWEWAAEGAACVVDIPDVRTPTIIRPLSELLPDAFGPEVLLGDRERGPGEL